MKILPSLNLVFLVLGFFLLYLVLKVFKHTKIYFARYASCVLMRLLYKIEVVGQENIPLKGAVLVSCNHESFVDWAMVHQGIKRPTRFVMHANYNKNPVLRFFAGLADIIPIAQKNEDSKVLRAAYENILQALKEGHVVCIFPEGGITYDGNRKPFKKGIEKISKTSEVNVIPMALYGFWGGIFSRAELNKPLLKRTWGFRRRAILKIGRPIPYSEVNTEQLQNITEEMIREIKY